MKSITKIKIGDPYLYLRLNRTPMVGFILYTFTQSAKKQKQIINAVCNLLKCYNKY